MTTITGPAGAGGALPPQDYTVARLVKLFGVTGTDTEKLAYFEERDGAALALTSEVYYIASQTASQTFKVVLKSTSDAEGNNPIIAVTEFTTPIAKS